MTVGPDQASKSSCCLIAMAAHAAGATLLDVLARFWLVARRLAAWFLT